VFDGPPVVRPQHWEALSRWCAADIGFNALSDFATGPQWVSDGMPDFVNRTDPPGQKRGQHRMRNASLSWLTSRGHGLDAIAWATVSLADLERWRKSMPASPQVRRRERGCHSMAIRALPNGVVHNDPFAGITIWPANQFAFAI
jgi:hypothetical protein